MQPTAGSSPKKPGPPSSLLRPWLRTAATSIWESEHLLLALLQQNGLAGRILSRTGVEVNNFQGSVEAYLKRQPSLGSSPESVFLGRSLNSTLDRAEYKVIDFGDSFIAIEHPVLALAGDDRCGRQLFSQIGLDATKLKEAARRCAAIRQ